MGKGPSSAPEASPLATATEVDAEKAKKSQAREMAKKKKRNQTAFTGGDYGSANVLG